MAAGSGSGPGTSSCARRPGEVAGGVMRNLVGQMLGEYRLVEQIGQGGMATVYRALDTRSLQDVAVKILSSSAVGDRGHVRRFRREAGVVKNVLRHPHIVPVLDYNEM